MPLYPRLSDSEEAIWLKIAWNLYYIVISQGITSLIAPGWSDNRETLIRKVCSYTAVFKIN